jgi:hypothetical protein
MKTLLDDWKEDPELITMVRCSSRPFIGLKLISLIKVLECMSTWPLAFRNKVEDSQVLVPVKVCAESENESIKTLAQGVSPFRSRQMMISYIIFSYWTIGILSS